MPTVATYCRVSTEEQNLDRQVQSTADYAHSRLDADLGDLRIYTDKSTGTNTERSGYQSMVDELHEIDAVVVNSVSRISRSIRDLDRTVDRFEEKNTDLHIISEGFEILPNDPDPYQRAMLQLLGVFAELEASMIQQRTREGIAARQADDDYHHGRPPFGFEKDNGHLVEAENFDHVVTVLEMVDKGNMSKRKAAKELDTSRPTIGAAVDRPELYGL